MPPDSEPTTIPDHPAQYSLAVLQAIKRVFDDHLPAPDLDPWPCVMCGEVQLASAERCYTCVDVVRPPAPDRPRILDAFAGPGHALALWAGYGYDVLGVELEPEWAAASPHVIVGDATQLDSLLAPDVGRLLRFDACVTSPCYGNRMADNHDARDASKRITYTHKLGRKPSTGSAAVLQWGSEYRRTHERFLAGLAEVLHPGGLVVINMKNHLRTPMAGGEQREQLVTEWWLNSMLVKGWHLVEVVRVPTPGMGFGANADARTDCEFLLVMRLPHDSDGRLAL